MKNRSPWLHQLDKTRARRKLGGDLSTDVAIVGAGIAGISTAFFLLKYTKKKVILIEGYKLAHGATGHNAGQVAAYFERSFASMVEEFGLARAAEGQRAVTGAWDLLNEMYQDAKLDIFFSQDMGYDGYSTYDQVVRVLEDERLKREGGVHDEHFAVALEAPFIDAIPPQYAGLWRALPQAQILEMLETRNMGFFAAGTVRKGSINSALFCERVATYLANAYPERFALYEHSPVHKVLLRKDSALLDVETFTVAAKRVVLCTNGFENFHIIDDNGLATDKIFHEELRGRVAYMSAYLEPAGKPPVTESYETPDMPQEDLPYYYMTRRPFEYEPGDPRSLISIGGPEEPFTDQRYSSEAEYPEKAIDTLDAFVRTIYGTEDEHAEYVFTWHGLMGYTQNGMRMVGHEPRNKVLLYNLGCNGVGILPSVMGGRKIARLLAGEKLPPSIFDVPEAPTPYAAVVASAHAMQ